MIDLKIYSFNVRGIGDGLKRRTIFRHLKNKYPYGIYLLQESHSSNDTEQKWKLEWNGDIYFSHGTSNSCGVTILIYPGLDLDVQILHKDNNGRLLALTIKTSDNSDIALYNIYAPVRGKVKEQIELLNYVKDIYANTDSLYTIMGGDFNTVFNPILDKQGGDMTGCTSIYTEELLAFIEAHDLIDAVRYHNPDKKIFTRIQRSPPVLSRIDHWLISSHLCNYLQAATAYPGIKSDHSIIFVHVTSSLVKRGRGFWKFNASLLQDLDYVQSVSNLIDNLKEETLYMSDKQLRWEYIKTEIRSFTLQFSSRKNKARREFKLKLEKDLYDMECQLHSGVSQANVDRYMFIKEEVEKIEEFETKGAILRSKTRWAEAGEKNTKYFLNLEKRNAIDKHICQLKVDDKIVTDPKEILLEQKLFYKKLYSETSCQNECEAQMSDIFTSTLPQLSEEENAICEGLVTEAECANALKDMQNGKSPGCDGYTVEFYKVFWKNIKLFVVESINFAFQKGELSVDQKRGIITLIPKKDKIRILLKNWRPITLLNTDYKILTKSLAIRLHKVLPSLIDLDQTGFLKGRYIGENIRTISDIIDYTSLRNQPGIILLLDFEKAFDTIKWSFIVNSLKHFNFGPDFIHWVEILYSNTESTVINNGNTAGFFKLQRGIRQGCPISPYLFIIAVEILANGIRKNLHVKGISVGSTIIKISQLADDTTVFVSDLQSVSNVLEMLEQFKAFSGLKLNLEKTIAKCIGSLEGKKYETLGLKWIDGPISTLGITISNNAQFILDNVFYHKLKTFGNILNMWNCRGLSLKGRVTILKSLALPKLLYPMSVLPIPTDVVDLVDNMIIDFIWNKRKPKIKKDVIIQSIENGGIKAPRFATMVEANRLSWIRRLMSDTNAKWKQILHELVKPMSVEHFSECYLDDASISSIGIPFYVQLYGLWNKIRQEPKSRTEILDQVIWQNRLIQLPSNLKKKNKLSLRWPDLYKAGICKVKHLFTSENKWIDVAEFCELNNVKYNFLQIIRVKKALPHDWISKITSRPQEGNACEQSNFSLISSNMNVNVCHATTKMIYDVLILKKYTVPTAITRWTEVFEIDECDWPSIYKQPYIASRETKLHSLQYKIINRIVSCKKWLHNLKVVDSPYCTHCNDVIDDIIHHFIECKYLNKFWNSIEKWWNRTAEYNIKLTNKHILFGFYYDNHGFETANYVVLLAKWFIQKQLYSELRVDLYDFLVVLKSHLQTEKYVCTNNGKQHLFTKKWSHIWNKL